MCFTLVKCYYKIVNYDIPETNQLKLLYLFIFETHKNVLIFYQYLQNVNKDKKHWEGGGNYSCL